MAALQNYLSQIGPLTGFTFGHDQAALAEVRASAGKPWSRAAKLAYAFETMQAAWNAMPASIRSQVLSGLRQARDNAMDALGDLNFEGGGMYMAILQSVVQFVEGLVKTSRQVDKNNKAYSLQYFNRAQRDTFWKAESSTAWAMAVVEGDRFMHYGGGVGKDRWRSRPALPMTGAELGALGLASPPAPTGNCDPGKPYRSKASGGWKAKNDSPKCEYWTAFSALYYPYWTPSLSPQPLPFYNEDVWPRRAMFKEAGVDPNKILIERQAELLSDPLINLRTNGTYVRALYDAFVAWFAANKSVSVDAQFAPLKQESSSPTPEYYFDHNGLLYAYARIAGIKGLSSDTVVATNAGVPVTVGAYNAVVSMTKAFFTARALFLEDTITIQTLLAEGQLGTFDPQVRAAAQDAAAPKAPGPGYALGGGIRMPERPPSGHPPHVPRMIVRWEPLVPPDDPGAPKATKVMFGGSLALGGAAAVATLVNRLR